MCTYINLHICIHTYTHTHTHTHVHSAGIGRTGVFILMETALCKMEVLEPIYPLEIVRLMRDQRGILVQTPVSLNSTIIMVPIS